MNRADPLGTLIDELRQGALRDRAGAGKAETRTHRPGRAISVRLETGVVSDPRPGSGPGPIRLWPLSLLLHAGLLAATVALPLLGSDSLPAPASATRAFFVGPGLIAPPPPPPPPSGAAVPAPLPTPRRSVETRALTAPVEIPDQVVPEETVDLGHADGQPGGVEGGIPGGVVGGVVGGLPTASPPVPPVRVGGGIKEPAKLRHVDPVYPDIAVRANVQGKVVVECTVSPLGRVTETRIVRGIPLLNAAAVEAVKQWVYTPTLRDGVPVPVILTVTVEFRLEERPRR